MKKHSLKPEEIITDAKVEDYALKHSTRESAQIHKLLESSAASLEFVDMLSGNLVGQLLQILIQISGAKKVLEVGTFTGYSAIMMAEVLPEDGQVTTLEFNKRYIKLAEKHFADSTVGSKIKIIECNARDEITKLEDTFDFAYLDADKMAYSHYFDAIIERLKPNGILVVDNVLWDAAVLHPIDKKAQAIDAFNKKVYSDKRVQKVLLPVRDGITIIRKL